MSLRTTKIATASALVALMGSTALADVTAQEAWDAFESSLMLEDENALSIGSEELKDGVLTISDLKLSSSFKDIDDGDSGEFVYALDQMIFAEQGDGTVKVTTSEDSSLMLSGNDASGPFELKMTLRQTGTEVIVSGTPEQMMQDSKSDSIKLIFDDMGPNVTLNGENYFEFTGFESSTKIDGVSTKTYDQTGKIAEMSAKLDLDIKDGEESGKIVGSGSVSELAFAAKATVPDMPMGPNTPMDAVMEAGLAFAGTFSSGPSTVEMTVQPPDDAELQITSSTGGSTLSGSFSGDELSYDAMSRDIAGQVTSDGLPFPITFSASEYGASLKMPLQPTDAPADFGLSLTLADLSVNDEIWALGDPQGILPRGPATLRAAVSGTAKLLVSFFDEDAMAEFETSDTPPAELHSARIDALELDAVGARVTGTGDLTFDNSDLETFDGMPVPEGKLNFQISGANALIDNLIKMGIIPQDEAMMTRMMLGMFAQSTGDDTMESDIEFRKGGEIYANGQRMR